MNRIIVALFIFVAFVFSVSAQEVATTTTLTAEPFQVTTLPTALGGRWYTPDRMYSQVFSLETNSVRKTALITYWSTRAGCSFEKLQGSLEGWDGKTLKVSLLDGQNLCHPTMLIELQPQGGRKWGGSIHLNMQVTGAPALVHAELEEQK